VTPGAPWCTLCYAELRPQPESAPAAAPVVAPAVAAPAPVHELPPDPILDGPGPIPVSAVTYSAVAATLAPPQPPVAREPAAVPQPEPAPAPARESAGWPCLGCGAVMPLEENFCTQCGRAFLPTETLPSLSLPVVGNLGGLDKAQRVWLMVGGAVGLTVLFFLLALVLGSIL
jgi:hypothetical protein